MIYPIPHSNFIRPETFFKIFAIVFILTGLVAWCKLALRRRRISKILPGYKLSLLNVLGEVVYVPWTKRNGYSFDVHLLQHITGHWQIFRKNKVSSAWVGNKLVVGFVSADAVKEFTGGSKNSEKAFYYKFLDLLFHNGLTNSNGEKWKSRRKLLNPAFHFDILKEYLYTMNEHSRTLVKNLQKRCTEDSTDIRPIVSVCTLDIICSTTMGVNVGSQVNNNSEFSHSIERISELIMKRITFFFLPEFLFNLTKHGIELKQKLKIAHNFTKKVMQERKKKFLSGDINVTQNKRKSLLDMLLDHHIKNPNDFTEEDIQEEVDTFIPSGYETTATAITFALYLIGLHKDAQAKLHEEMDFIFGEDIDREVTNDDINEMKYLDCVIKESQRIFPTIPYLGRNVTEDINVCGYSIPKGVMGGISVYDLHRDPEVFPVPEKFDPNRFLPENSRNRHPYAYIPFAAGARNCIGQRLAQMEMKVIISHILRNYTVESPQERDKLVLTVKIALGTVQPIQIRIRPRIRR